MLDGGDEDMDEPEAARPDNQEMITEALFSFEAFQMVRRFLLPRISLQTNYDS